MLGPSIVPSSPNVVFAKILIPNSPTASGSVLEELTARASGCARADMGALSVRPPLKPVRVGELAGLAE